MRVVVIVIAALMTLGLAAFGVVAAHNTEPGRLRFVALAAHIVSPAQTTDAPAPRRACRRTPGAHADPAVSRDPVIQVSDHAPRRRRAAPCQRRRRQRRRRIPTAGAAAGRSRKRPAATPAKAIPTCDNPDALGLSRIVEIDTTGGPAFGTEHFKQYDFLRDKEVVLTFDDGPWPDNTPMVLKALADNCTKATFFEIGEHATWHPEITKAGGRRPA